jgi:protein subunit release factor A
MEKSFINPNLAHLFAASKIGSGMRGDKRRTYRFQDDTLVDHVIGKTMQASKAMKGGMGALWR